jgi:hypothetical protein
MTTFRLLMLGLFGAFGFAQNAEARQYLCDFKDPGRYNTIPLQVLIIVAPDGKSAEVVDPMLIYFEQAPKPAKFFLENDKLLRVQWRIDDAEFSTGGNSDMNFSLVYKKAKGRAFITLSITSYDNTDSGNGSCKLKA